MKKEKRFIFCKVDLILKEFGWIFVRFFLTDFGDSADFFVGGKKKEEREKIYFLQS